MNTMIRVALLATLLLAGCSRVTLENYQKLEAGMTHEQVYALLGKPDQVSGGGVGNMSFSNETWSGGGRQIRLTFGGDKLLLKTIEDSAKP